MKYLSYRWPSRYDEVLTFDDISNLGVRDITTVVYQVCAKLKCKDTHDVDYERHVSSPHQDPELLLDPISFGKTNRGS